MKLNNISKKYDSQEKNSLALNNISISINQNKIIGLVGKNGSGKTTLLKILAKHIFPTQGHIENLSEKNTSISLSNDFEPIFSNFKLEHIIKIASDCYCNFDEIYARKLLEKFNLNLNVKYMSLSKGQSGLFNFIIGLCSYAQLTLFDETFVSCDIPTRKLLLDEMLDSYIEHPRTIILSSHYIQEFENYLEAILIIDKGKIAFHTSRDELDSKALRIIVPEKISDRLYKNYNVLNSSCFGSQCDIKIYDELSTEDRNYFKSHNCEISKLKLDELFIAITEEDLNHD